MTYQPPDLPLLADELEGIGIESIQSEIPGFSAPDGDPFTTINAATALQQAELAALVYQTAEQLVITNGMLDGLPPLDAVAATMTTTWNLSDDDGHTIEAGWTVQVTAADGTTTRWVVQTPVTVAAAATATGAGEVVLVAEVPGAAGNDVAGDVVAIQPKVLWLDTITVVTPGANGVDAESFPAYLNRLTTERTLRTRLIVKADHLAAAASLVPGVGRALARRTWKPGGPNPSAGDMTVAVCDLEGEDFPSVHPEIEALPTGDGVTIYVVNFDRHPVAVTATVIKHDDYDAAVVKASCESALEAFFSPLAWASRPEGEAQQMYVDDTIRLDQVAGLLNNQPGVKYVDFSTVEIGVDGDPLAATDATLTGDFPITYVDDPADLVVTVT